MAHSSADERNFRLFKSFANEAKSSGFERYSAKAIFERMRWFAKVEKGDPFFKLNNNNTSKYARRLMQEDPNFHGFFETRRSPGLVMGRRA